jgi:hypothetical protein
MQVERVVRGFRNDVFDQDQMRSKLVGLAHVHEDRNSLASRGESRMAMKHVDGDVRPEFAEDVGEGVAAERVGVLLG